MVQQYTEVSRKCLRHVGQCSGTNPIGAGEYQQAAWPKLGLILAKADVLRQMGTNSRKKSYEYISNKRKTKVSTAYYQKENNRGCIKIEIHL